MIIGEQQQNWLFDSVNSSLLLPLTMRIFLQLFVQMVITERLPLIQLSHEEEDFCFLDEGFDGFSKCWLYRGLNV